MKDGKSGKVLQAGELHVHSPGGREWSVCAGDRSYDEGPGEPWQLLKGEEWRLTSTFKVSFYL